MVIIKKGFFEIGLLLAGLRFGHRKFTQHQGDQDGLNSSFPYTTLRFRSSRFNDFFWTDCLKNLQG